LVILRAAVEHGLGNEVAAAVQQHGMEEESSGDGKL
jgi:hypothetical protein